ncbi:hypothetical protein ACFQBQ_04825 [Granulicella cerasi]|uniref:IrrE N-terminal-like domain-containing protein n=1 Tax=Granulicella cerasi TaxID=741063 RepID=A0ABW1Z7G2_9BACT
MKAVLQASKSQFPKFYASFSDIQQHDALIRQIRFERGGRIARSVANARPNGVITIDLDFLDHPRPQFDDNRMVVVLFHEIGHLHYYQTTAPEQRRQDRSEQAAFEYSLLKTKEMAVAGDCGPLATGVHFMKVRSEGRNLDDPHVRALKRMVREPLYAEYVAWVQQHCAASASSANTP